MQPHGLAFWHPANQEVSKQRQHNDQRQSEYGQITTAKLKAECESFCLPTGACSIEQASQNNQMMSECIMKTLTTSACNCLLPFRKKIDINNVVYSLLLHKKVTALATIDSKPTTKALCASLREITTYCATVKGDTDLLHAYFDTNYSQIIACGAGDDDPVDILFAAYAIVPCALF